MQKETTIELFKENMKFSAGHFTIFSETKREKLHGHNFRVFVSIQGKIKENGLLFDYRLYKKKIRQICKRWNEVFILPENSNYLKFKKKGKKIIVIYGKEKIPFLKKDVLLLPIENASVEEFSRLIANKIVSKGNIQFDKSISKIIVKVFSGPGQSASYEWLRKST